MSHLGNCNLSSSNHTTLSLSGGSQQAFDAHFDWMDVLILQLEGCKHWKIYTPPAVLFPTKDLVTKPNTSSPSFRILQEFDLTAGSMAYIPRGFVHEAATNCSSKEPDFESKEVSIQELSMHLTIGLTLITYIICTLPPMQKVSYI